MNALPPKMVSRISLLANGIIKSIRLCFTKVVFLGAINALTITDVCAWGWRDEPVDFRINLALDRVSSYTDVIARSASAAHPLGSSVNPASDDFLRSPPFDFKAVATVSSNSAFFNSGAWISGVAATGEYRLAEAGTISALVVRTDSHDAKSRQGDAFTLRSNQFSLGYSQRISQRYAVGGSIRITDGALGIDDSLSGFPRNTKTDSLGGDFTLGVLLSVNEQWLVGLLGGAGWTQSNTKGKVALPQPPFGPGPLGINQRETTRSGNVRAGIGWQPLKNVGFYADSQYLHLDNKRGSADVGRIFLGTELFPLPVLALRLGTSLDSEVKASLSAGLGIYVFKRVPLEIAYSYNAFPEVQREFGRAHLMSLSLAVVF